MAVCDKCGKETSLPYSCGYCGKSFCSEHRLPENHECEGLDDLEKETKEKGQIYRGVSEELEEEKPVDYEISGSKYTLPGRDFEEREIPFSDKDSKDSGTWSMIKNFFLSNTTSKILLIIILVHIGQLIATGVVGDRMTVVSYLGPSAETILTRPWTVLTSIFTHGSFGHLLINGLVLFFIGSALERRIGSKKFLYLFLSAGVIAALAQVFITQPGVPVVGASGGVFGILGALTVIAPKLPVLLFFVVPMPLWVLTVGYGLIEGILAVTNPGSMVGHVAHFAGLVVGAGVGYYLRKKIERRSKNVFESMLDRMNF